MTPKEIKQFALKHFDMEGEEALLPLISPDMWLNFAMIYADKQVKTAREEDVSKDWEGVTNA